MEPHPTQPSSAERLRACVVACLGSGLTLGALDWASASARGAVAPLALPAGLALAGTAGVVLGVGLAVAGAAASALDGRLARLRWVIVGVGALLLALPLLGLTLLLGATGRASAGTLGLIGGGAALTLVAGALVGARVGTPAGWLLGAAASAQLLQAAAASVRLLDRVGEARIGTFAVAAVAGSVAAVGLAAVLALLVRAASGRALSPGGQRRSPPGRARASSDRAVSPGVDRQAPRPAAPARSTATLPRLAPAAAALVGAVAFLAIPSVLAPHHASARIVALTGCFALLALGALPLARRITGRVGAAVGIAAIAGTAALPFALSPLSTTAWTLASRTTLSRAILTATGLLDRGTEQLLAELRQHPHADLGRRAHEAAQKWNAEPAAFPDAEGASIVLLTIDSLRYDHVGYSGLAEPGLTPAMDRIAARAVRFHRAYAQGGWTSLSLPALLWSRYPKDIAYARVLYDHDLRAWLEHELPPGSRIKGVMQAPAPEGPPGLAALLGDAGFATLAVPNDGFNRLLHPRLGFTRGFEEVVYPPAVLTGTDGRTPVEIDDAAAMDVALGALREVADRRFFMWIHLFDPHMPNRPREGATRFGYSGEVAFTDAQVGRLLDTLAELGLEERTVVVLTSDHGESLGEHDSIEHGINLYEESVRVPLLVVVPGVPASDVDSEVGLIDIAPTLLHVAGERVPESMVGFTLAPYLEGETPPRPPVPLETWRLDATTGAPDLHLVGAVSHRKKVVFDLLTGAIAFLDLDKDATETGEPTSGEAWEDLRALAAWVVGWYGL